MQTAYLEIVQQLGGPSEQIEVLLTVMKMHVLVDVRVRFSYKVAAEIANIIPFEFRQFVEKLTVLVKQS